MKLIKYTEKLFIVENFLSKKACRELIDLSENIGYEKAKVQVGNNQQSLITGIRNNERILYKKIDLADKLYKKSKGFLPKKIGKYNLKDLNEMFRFYKYEKGQRFKKHKDGSYERNKLECSFYTFMIYLNDDFEGGETNFENDYIIKPKQGSLLLFYHPLKHEGKEVTNRIKYVLRSDVMYRLNKE